MMKGLITLLGLVVTCSACSTIRENAFTSFSCESPKFAAAESAAKAVTLLVAAGRSIPVDRWARYRESALVATRCAPPGARFSIFGITNVAIGTPAMYAGSVPSPDADHPLDSVVQYPARRRAFVIRVSRILDSLPRVALEVGVSGSESYPLTKGAGHLRRYLDGSDAVGALKAAADDFAVLPGKKVLFVIFNGWQQSGTSNLFKYHLDPRGMLGVVIRQLREADAMPNLAHVDVYILGISQGAPGMEASDIQLTQLCGFWTHFTKEAGATLKACTA